VLNVVRPLDAGMSEGGVLEADDKRQDEALERAERLVEQARERAEAEGRTVETAVESGDPAETILAYVEDHGSPRSVEPPTRARAPTVVGGHATGVASHRRSWNITSPVSVSRTTPAGGSSSPGPVETPPGLIRTVPSVCSWARW
jgi:nucleotide-binding universal stress UspA family protein